MDIKQFRKIKERMQFIYKTLDAETPDNAEELFAEYFSLQEELLKSDLSEIPFEEWKGMFLVQQEGVLDFSNTHANLDFSLFDIYYDDLNLRGCNVRGVDFLHIYKEEYFDQDYIDSHPEYFLDKSLPNEIREKYYNKKIELNDLIEYPSLIKNAHENCFARNTKSFELVQLIGLDNATIMINDEPDLIRFLTDEEHEIELNKLDSSNFENMSYEQAKEVIYERIVTALKNEELKLSTIEVLPEDFKKKHPNMYFDNSMDKELVDVYYAGNLTARHIRVYKEQLKDKDLDIGIRSNRVVKKTKAMFGTFDKYLELVPVQLDYVVSGYLYDNIYNDLSNVTEENIEEFLSQAIRKTINEESNVPSIYEVNVYKNYIPLEEIYTKDKELYSFIQKCGFETLVQYNANNSYILGNKRFLKLLAQYSKDLGDVTIQSIEDLETYFSDIILKIKNSEDKYSLNISDEKIINAFPRLFITEQDLNYAVSIADKKDKNLMERLLNSALNNDVKDLIYLLNKYKELLPMFEDKIISYDSKDSNWYWDMVYNPIYENYGKEVLLDICTKYGKSIIAYVEDWDTLKEMVNQLVNSKNYESVINDYLYNSNIQLRHFDIRMLPESFKTKYSELFLPKDAPKELCDLFYRDSEDIYRNTITEKDISAHPEWHKYLTDVDLAKILPTKWVFEDYSNNNNLYTIMAQYMSRQEVNEFIIKYGKYIRDCSFTFSKNYSNEEFKESLYKNIYENIIKRKIVDYTSIPIEIKEKYPNIFLKEPINPELKDYFFKFQDAFYNRKVDGEYIRNYPQCLQFLKDVDLNVIFAYMPVKIKIYEKEVNVVDLIEKMYGRDKAFEILSIYDKYLTPYASLEQKNSLLQEPSIENINKCAYEMILDRKLPYGEYLFESFIKEYPTMFLPKDAPKELKEKFYKRELTLNALASYPDALDYFENTNIAWGFKEETKWLINLFENESTIVANYKKIKIINEYQKIEDKSLQEMFKDFVLNDSNNLSEEKIEIVAEMLQRLSKTNSLEMYTYKEELASQLIKMDAPLNGLDKIEEIFVKNHLPVVGKAYSVFNILHPEFSGFNFEEHSKVSPVLKGKSNRGREIIVFSDLIRASFGSNNRTARNYITTLKKGNELYETLKNNPNLYEQLSDKDKKLFILFSSNLMTLYNNTYRGKLGDCVEFSSNPVERVNQLYRLLSPVPDINPEYNLPDRAVSMFCHFAGFDTLEQIEEFAERKVQKAEARNIESSKAPMKLEKGDFVKGIGDIQFLSKILQNGSVAKEYLGGASAGSDMTPLDTDLSRIVYETSSVSATLEQTLAKNYGPIWFVLKNDDRFAITRETVSSSEIAISDMNKLEAFATNNDSHYGIRTGFPSTDINYIMIKEKDERIELELAINGFYIPIVNTSGEIIFTPSEYDQLRTKMGGISYYGIDTYDISLNLVNEETTRLASQISASREETAYKREVINKHITEALDMFSQSYGQEMSLKTKSDGDLSEGTVELIDTGSTGRGTNKPGEGDFDFMMKLDKSLIEKPEQLEEFKSTLLNSFGLSKEQLQSGEITWNGDFRLKGVALDGVVVDIDITFAQKTDAIQYSTDESLVDRLSVIKEKYPQQYDYVLANIILAKQVLKEAGAYKRARGETPQGGLGGGGIENWVLQHGGSFEDAAKSFLESSNGKTFEEFKKTYKVWDFGENHVATNDNVFKSYRYPHDNFVSCNMNETGFEKMKNALYSYFVEKQRGQSVIPQESNIGTQKL